MSAAKGAFDRGLNLLRSLPRVGLSNIKNIPGAIWKTNRGRGQHGGKTHGAGSKGSGQRQNFMRLGYETGKQPFYLKFPWEPYYKGHHVRRQYPPLSLFDLQKMIDTDRLDPKEPIDLTAICNSGIYRCDPSHHHYGVNLTDEGAEVFKAKVNIEVQWTTEPVIAAIERNGGTITTAFYDIQCVIAAINPRKFFRRGEPIPLRMLPPADAVKFYSDPKTRGYLADPKQVSWERFVLAQKYGYNLPKIEEDPDYELLCLRKDPRQLFFGLEPGWLINIADKQILKPLDPKLQEYYHS